MNKFPFSAGGEVQSFIGVENRVRPIADSDALGLELTFHRAMFAGSANSLYCIFKEVLCFQFNNRKILINIPEQQQTDLFAQLKKAMKDPRVRHVVIKTETNYINNYTGEVVSTSSEKTTLEKLLLTIYLTDISDTDYYMPAESDSVLVSAAEHLSSSEKPVLSEPLRSMQAVKSLEYFKDVGEVFYLRGFKMLPHYYFVNPDMGSIGIDNFVTCSHVPYSEDMEELPKLNVTFRSKTGDKSVNLEFIDPGQCLEELFKDKSLTLRFRDGLLYGIDLKLADIEVDVYTP